MTYYSILTGFDVKSLKLQQRCTHYQVKALIVADQDVLYASNSTLLASSGAQGVVEVNFQKFVKNPVFLLQLTLIEQYDTQMHQKEIMFFHADSQFQFLEGAQTIEFSQKQDRIACQLALSEVHYEALTTIPFVEISARDFRMPLSGLLFSSHLAVEIQTDGMHVTKFMGGMQCDISGLQIPFQASFLLKIIYLINIYGTPHSFVLCNAKIQNSQTLIKGALVEITEIDAKLDKQIVCLIDTLISLISAGKDEMRDSQGMKIKLSGLMNPYFLQRFVLFKNSKLVETNLPRFASLPVLCTAIEKKLQKIYDSEMTVCQNLAENCSQYSEFDFAGNLLFAIQTFPLFQKSQQQVFRDLCAAQKSVALAAMKINALTDDYGFALLSNKEIEIQKCIQQFEVGTGNLAYCNVQDSKQYLQLMHRGNYNQAVKLLANSSKSLVQATAKGLALYVFAYEMAVPFKYQQFVFTRDEIERNINSQICLLTEKIGGNAWLRLYVQDLLYCEKNSITAAGMPDDSFRQVEVQQEESANDAAGQRASVSSKMSFVSRVYSEKKFDPMRWVDYFGQKTKSTQFCAVSSKYCKTLREFIREDLEERQREEREKKEREERKRREEEERVRLEAERVKKEEEERRRMEEERAAAEKLRREQEEEALKEAQRQEEERLRQVEQLKLLQLKAQKGPVAGRQPKRRISAPRQEIRQIDFQLDEELVQMRMDHKKQASARNARIQELMARNQARLRSVELEFQKQTLTIQAQIEEAKMLQMNALLRLQALQEEEAKDDDDLQRQEDEFLLEQVRTREQIQLQHESRLKLLDERFQADLQRDQQLAVERKLRCARLQEEQRRREEEFHSGVKRRYEESQRRYAAAHGRSQSESVERQRQRQQNAPREEWRPLTQQDGPVE